MENVSKTLLIVGAIIVCILLISVGMYVLNNSQSKVTASLASMSTQEIDAHNTKFAIYDGEQSGSRVKSLIGILMTNSSNNVDEEIKVPGLYVEFEKDSMDSGLLEDGTNTSYITVLEDIRSQLDSKHTYWFELSYQDNGLIDYITISYDVDDTIEPMSRK